MSSQMRWDSYGNSLEVTVEVDEAPTVAVLGLLERLLEDRCAEKDKPHVERVRTFLAHNAPQLVSIRIQVIAREGLA